CEATPCARALRAKGPSGRLVGRVPRLGSRPALSSPACSAPARPMIVPDSDPGSSTLPGLVALGVLDAELAALVWLLVEGGVPLVVGGMDADARAEVARAVLGVDPARPWVLIDAEAHPPTLEELAALLMGGTAVGLSVEGTD